MIEAASPLVSEDVSERDPGGRNAGENIPGVSLQSELLFAALEPLPLAVAITDLRGTVKFANAALTSLTGYAADEIVGQYVASFGAAQPSFYHLVHQVISTGVPWTGESFWRRKTANAFSAKQTVTAVKGPHGRIASMMVTIEDSGGRNQLKEQLRQTKDRLEALEKAAGAASWTWNSATGIINVSPEWLQLHGLAPQTSVKNWEAFCAILHPDDRERVRPQAAGLSAEYRVVLPGGGVRWIGASGHPGGDPDRACEMIGVCIDLTERKRIDPFAAEAKRDFERFFNLIPDLACIVGTDGYFRKVNPAWETTLGYTQEEVLRTPMLEFIHPDDLERSVNEAAKQSRDYRTKHFVNRYRCKDGSYRLFDWTTTFNRDESTRFGVARDITEQRLWEESLRESEERFRIMADSCPTIIWVTDSEGRIVMTNRTCREFFGIEADHPGDSELRLCIHPDDQAAYLEKFLRAVRERAPFQAEARARRSDGEWRWIVSYGEPRMSLSGDFLGHVGISPDITDRKQSEVALEKAKNAAEIANRSKSEFLANMSHEIRTPMNGVIGLTDLALGTDLTVEQRSYLDGVKTSAESLLRILNDILDFSKIEAGKLEFEAIEFDPRQTVGALLKVLGANAAAKNLELACDIAFDVPSRVLGDPGRLKQILVNLAGNAIKFTERGEVVVSVEQTPNQDAGMELHFSVRDTGIGIPAAKQQHVFSAFAQADTSSTRQFGGTGLGLTYLFTTDRSDGRTHLARERRRQRLHVSFHGAPWSPRCPFRWSAPQTCSRVTPGPARSYRG